MINVPLSITWSIFLLLLDSTVQVVGHGIHREAVSVSVLKGDTAGEMAFFYKITFSIIF